MPHGLPKIADNNKKRPHSVPPYSRPGIKRPYNRPSDAGDEVRDLVPVVEDDYTISYRQACHKMSHPDRLAQGERIEANKKPRQACSPSGLSHLMGLCLRQLWPLEA